MLITAATIGSQVAARFPAFAQESGVLDSVNAQGETVATIHAQAVRSYIQPSGNLVFVRALTAHFVAGQYVDEGDIVQVTDTDAKLLANMGRTIEATAEEVAAAQADAQKATKAK